MAQMKMEGQASFELEDDIEKLLIGNLLDGNDEQLNFGREKCRSSAGARNGKENRHQPAENEPMEKDFSGQKAQLNGLPSKFKGRTFYSTTAPKWQFWGQKYPSNGYNCGGEYEPEVEVEQREEQQEEIGGHFGPFHVRGRFVPSEGREEPNWPRVRGEGGVEFYKPRPPMFGQKRSKSINQMNEQNQPQMGQKSWQHRAFKSWHSRKELPPQSEGHNQPYGFSKSFDELNEAKTQPPSPDEKQPVEKKPSLPIGFCPVDKKKQTLAKEQPNKNLNTEAGTKEGGTLMEAVKKKTAKLEDSTDNEFQPRPLKVAKARTISMSKCAKIAEEAEMLQAPLAEFGTGNELKLAPVGRFQVLSRIGGLSASNVNEQQQIGESKPSRQRRANSVAVDSNTPAAAPTALAGLQIGSKPSQGAKKALPPPLQIQSKSLPASIWAKLLDILLALFPIFASLISQSDDVARQSSFGAVKGMATAKSPPGTNAALKRALRKQNSQNGTTGWKMHFPDSGLTQNRMAIFGFLGRLLGLLWRALLWPFSLVWECLRLLAKSVIISFQCLRARLAGALPGYG